MIRLTLISTLVPTCLHRTLFYMHCSLLIKLILFVLFQIRANIARFHSMSCPSWVASWVRILTNARSWWIVYRSWSSTWPIASESWINESTLTQFSKPWKRLNVISSAPMPSLTSKWSLIQCIISKKRSNTMANVVCRPSPHQFWWSMQLLIFLLCRHHVARCYVVCSIQSWWHWWPWTARKGWTLWHILLRPHPVQRQQTRCALCLLYSGGIFHSCQERTSPNRNYVHTKWQCEVLPGLWTRSLCLSSIQALWIKGDTSNSHRDTRWKGCYWRSLCNRDDARDETRCLGSQRSDTRSTCVPVEVERGNCEFLSGVVQHEPSQVGRAFEKVREEFEETWRSGSMEWNHADVWWRRRGRYDAHIWVLWPGPSLIEFEQARVWRCSNLKIARCRAWSRWFWEWRR